MTVALTYPERVALKAIVEATEKNDVCPSNLDLEELVGYSSTSMGPKLMRLLEEKGLIKVERFQRFRRVMLIETGKWTAKPALQKTRRKHVPRGCGSAVGKVAKRGRTM